jgi:hypothetical protein
LLGCSEAKNHIILKSLKWYIGIHDYNGWWMFYCARSYDGQTQTLTVVTKPPRNTVTLKTNYRIKLGLGEVFQTRGISAGDASSATTGATIIEGTASGQAGLV